MSREYVSLFMAWLFRLESRNDASELLKKMRQGRPMQNEPDQGDCRRRLLKGFRNGYPNKKDPAAKLAYPQERFALDFQEVISREGRIAGRECRDEMESRVCVKAAEIVRKPLVCQSWDSRLPNTYHRLQSKVRT